MHWNIAVVTDPTLNSVNLKTSLIITQCRLSYGHFKDSFLLCYIIDNLGWATQVHASLWNTSGATDDNFWVNLGLLIALKVVDALDQTLSMDMMDKVVDKAQNTILFLKYTFLDKDSPLLT